ncbi:MAG: restriction endonuclease subunit S [Oscillospiraceae bacterium]
MPLRAVRACGAENYYRLKRKARRNACSAYSDNLPYAYCEQIGKEIRDISDEIPFDIPDSWEWCRLSSILNKLTDGTHSTPKYVEKGVPFISVKDVSSGKLDFSKCKYITETEHKLLFERCNPELNDILLTKVGTTGIPVIVDTEDEFSLFVSVALLKFNQDFIYNKYLVHLINSPLVQIQATENTKGVGNKNWVMRDIANTLIVIPPLSEQKRIVSKIEELLPYIEAYEQAETQLTALNTSFPDILKKSILQEAVQGKLVPQNPDDEPASVLLERIRAEKQELIKQGKIKKDKHESVIVTRDKIPYEIQDGKERCIADEVPFEIPESWEWVRLGNIFKIGTGMTPLKSESLFYMNGNIPWVTSSLTNQKFIEKADTYITEYALNNTTLELYPADTLIIAMYGQGKTRGQISILKISATINQACAALSPICNYNGLNDYIYYFFIYNYDSIRKKAEGTSQPNLNLDKLKNTLLPLPPLAEQKRIVEKIEELMTFCEKLK